MTLKEVFPKHHSDWLIGASSVDGSIEMHAPVTLPASIRFLALHDACLGGELDTATGKATLKCRKVVLRQSV